MKKVTRREFIKTSASLVAAYGLAGCSESTQAPIVEPEATGMAKRALGKTGFNARLFSLGGCGALEIPGEEDVAEAIINRALELGVNYIDTAAYYGADLGAQGLSERNIGKATKSCRKDVFIATKSIGRTYDLAMWDLDYSLMHLQTDYIDLWQVHCLRLVDDLNAILLPDGAYKAFEKAKADGTVRFIGLSGHKDPLVLQQAITTCEFDAVTMALNAADIHYKSFILNALPAALDREMGIIAMKIPARGRLFRPDGITTMKEALGYTLTHPVSTAIVGCTSVADVEDNVQLALDFKPYSEAEMQHLEGLTASYPREGGWFKDEW